MSEERIRAKVINMESPGEHVSINFNGKRYGYQADEEYDMPKFIFDYLNSIEKMKWVQNREDRAPRQVKTRCFMAVKVEKTDDDTRKKVISEVLKDETKKKKIDDILED